MPFLIVKAPHLGTPHPTGVTEQHIVKVTGYHLLNGVGSHTAIRLW